MILTKYVDAVTEFHAVLKKWEAHKWDGHMKRLSELALLRSMYWQAMSEPQRLVAHEFAKAYAESLEGRTPPAGELAC